MENQNIEEVVKPPVTEVGVIGWMKKNLFNSPFNSILTLLSAYLVYKIVPPMVNWAFIGSKWMSTGDECRMIEGACWSVIPHNIRFILFGLYPADLHWRPALAVIILFGMLYYTSKRVIWKKSLIYQWLGSLVIMAWLMKGGLGLQVVDTNQWSGLPLTLILSLFGMFFAYPLGVLLALGRQSKMPAIKSLCVVYIEMIRGVPLISLLFMASVMLPLFLPDGVTINEILRAQIAIILFTGAYIAEVVRGGLQAMDKGQYEAADAIGLSYYQKMKLVILPQALTIVIPPTVGILISAFKDTSLVAIIGLFDLLLTAQTRLSNPEWMGFSAEMYIFLSIAYFIMCFFMADYSRKLEKEQSKGNQR